MEGGMVFDNPSITCVMPPHDDPLLDSLWIPTSSAPFHGSTPMANFEGENATNINKPFLTPVDKEETDEAGEGDEDDRCFHPAGKKRRLTIDQVQFLERSFEVENKLEPDRKLQLAKELNLQPRQVAIWFQNRRARYKTKQLEKDYDLLKSSYHKLKVDYETLQSENEKLKHEVLLLTEKLVEKEEKSKGNSDPCEPKLDVVDSQTAQKTTPIVTCQNVSKNVPETVVCKQGDANSAKSDVLDSDSPHYSSHVFEQDHSDFSQDDEDNFRCSFLSRPPRFPKIEDESFIDPIGGSCDLMDPVEDQLFWPWP